MSYFSTRLPFVMNPFVRFKNFHDGTLIYEKNCDRPHSQGSIVKYDSKWLTTFGWIIPRHGSVFTWFEMIFIILSTIGICRILALLSCDNITGDFCILLLKVPSGSYLTLTTLVAFVMGLFISAILSRWWSVRLHFQSAMGACVDFTMHMAGILAAIYHSKNIAPATKEKGKIILKRLSGLFIFCFRLLLNSARQEENSTRPWDDLIADEYITDIDVTHFKSFRAGPTHVLCLIICLLQEAARDGLLGPTPGYGDVNLKILMDNISSIRMNMSMITCYIDTQVPYPFVHILTLSVYAFMIQLIYVCAGFVSLGIHENDSTVVGVGYITVTLYAFVLLGYLKLYTTLENPLGVDAADFPSDTYVVNLSNTLSTIRQSSMGLPTSPVSLESDESSGDCNDSLNPILRTNARVHTTGIENSYVTTAVDDSSIV